MEPKSSKNALSEARAIVFLAFLTAMIGCSLEYPEKKDWRGLSAEEYSALLDEDDPCSLISSSDSSNIDFATCWDRDSNENWWRMSGISVDDYNELFVKVESQLTSEGFAMNRVINGVKEKPNGIPGHWPNPSDSKPDWWANNIKDSIVTTWEKESSAWPTVRSYGWQIVYHRDDELLYVWRWDYQHSWLGWTDEQRVDLAGSKKLAE